MSQLSYLLVLGAIGTITAAPDARNPVCREKNGYHPIDGNCDAYIECHNFEAMQMMCPDGLHYNPQAEWPAYPCGYPADVTCQGRGATQPAQPTAECPHQYGFFKSPTADALHCGSYRMCVEGKAIDMQCPVGLAFNPDSARCDWPDLVPSCNAEQYLGFQCPPAPLDENGEPMEVVNYAYEGSCYAFYSCEHGKPRLLTCDPGFSFDPARGHCVDESDFPCAVPVLSPRAQV